MFGKGEMIMETIYKVGKVIKVVGICGMVGGLFLAMGIAGNSDYEVASHTEVWSVMEYVLYVIMDILMFGIGEVMYRVGKGIEKTAKKAIQ